MHAHYSPGSLPRRDVVAQAVDAAHARFGTVDDGDVSTVYPALARARRDAFAIAVADVDGDVHAVGDRDEPFTLMSVAKPFVFALVCATMGVDEARDAIGTNATGRGFNSLDAVPASPDGRTNAMVNPGAIATTSRVPGSTQDERWSSIIEWLSRFAGRTLDVDEEVLESSLASNQRNRELASQVADAGLLGIDANDAVELYTRQSAVSVTTRDLVAMGATLATGGVNPVTGDRVAAPRVCRHVLTTMATAGMYERSGDWLWDVGLPGKSGISGGIVTIAPGKGALATWSPLVDEAGNSVRGSLAAEQLALELGLDLFAMPPS